MIGIACLTVADWNHEITRWLKSLRLPPARESEIVEELSQHVEDRYRELLAAGEDEATAVQTALDELRCSGILVEQLQKDQPGVFRLRDGRQITSVIWRDVRHGLRTLATLATLTVVLALGLMYRRTSNSSIPVNPSAGYVLSSPSPVLIADVDRDEIANHQVCALSYPPDWTFDRQRIASHLPPNLAPLIDAIGRNHGAYELIEGHICSYQQKQYAHLIFRGSGHTVSVSIERNDPNGNPKPSQPRKIHQTSYAAYQVASIDKGCYRISVVSDLPSIENLALAKQIVPATLSFIRKLERQEG